MADRMAVLKDGRLLQCDTPHAIYERPADRFVADFIGVMNFVPGTCRAERRQAARTARCIAGALPAGTSPRAAGAAPRCGPSASGCSRARNRTTASPARSRRWPIMGSTCSFTSARRWRHKPFLVRVTADAADRRPVAPGDSVETRLGRRRHQHFRRLTDSEEKPMAQKTIAFFPGSRLWAGAQLRRHRPGRRGARPQGGVPVRSRLRRRLQGLRLRGASGEPVRADAARADGQVLGGLHQRPHPELPQIALRPDRQLCEGLLDRDRRQREMGAEGPARRAGAGSSRT